ncbi:MAG: hypothetical protein JXR69_11020 [Candidatus Delongbacteria bacterium]|nr:hypothetical protein [Candidatus Delongbacteria bacterium]
MFIQKRIAFIAIILVALCVGLFAGDGKALEKQSAKIVKKVERAATGTAEAYSYIYDAIGKEKETKELQKLTQDLKIKDKVDLDKLEKSMETIVKYGTLLETIDLAKEVISEEGKGKLGMSIVSMTVATNLYNEATDESKELLPKAEKALKGLSGFSAMKEAGPIKEAIGNCKWVGEKSPAQMKQLATAMTKVTDYSKANGIPLPTKDEIEKKAAEL